MNVRRITREAARRIAVRAQLLDASRPESLLAVVERLTMLQLDPTAAIAPSADLVAWSRLGNTYQPQQLQAALEHDRSLFEHRGQPLPTEPVIVMVRPMAHLSLYLADMANREGMWAKGRAWLDANAGFRQRVLDQLAGSGPLQSRQIPDSADVSWESTGWTKDRNVTQMLEFLASHGEVAVSARVGRQRVWDLAERVYPPGMTMVPAPQARQIRDSWWLRAMGVARPKHVGDAGEPVEIEGTAGLWRLDPDANAGDFEGRTALLSPFDRLIHDRVRAVELFDFEYTLEMYKPAAKRRWGYFALPMLHHDRLVGKVDATVDRAADHLVVNALHRDVTFTPAMVADIDAELHALASWLGLSGVR